MAEPPRNPEPTSNQKPEPKTLTPRRSNTHGELYDPIIDWIKKDFGRFPDFRPVIG